MFLSIEDWIVLGLLTTYVDSTNPNNIDTENEPPISLYEINNIL